MTTASLKTKEPVTVTFYTEAEFRAEFGDAYVDEINSRPFDNSPALSPKEVSKLSGKFRKRSKKLGKYLENLEAIFEDSKLTFEERYKIFSHPSARPADVREFNKYGHALAKESGLKYNPIRIKSKGRDRSRRRRAQAEWAAKKTSGYHVR